MTMFAVFDTKNQTDGRRGYPWALGDHDDASTTHGGPSFNVMAMEVESDSSFDLAYGHQADETFGNQVNLDGTGMTLWQFQGAERTSMQVFRDHVRVAQTAEELGGRVDLPLRNRISLGCMDFAGSLAEHPAMPSNGE
jgi:hypothetical protein